MRLQLIRLVAVLFVLTGLGTAFAQTKDTSAPPTKAPSSVEGTVGFELGAYADSDHTFVVTPTVAGSVTNPLAGWSVKGDYLVDVVSAASVDIVSTSSRRWTEVRNAGDLSGTYQKGDVGVGASASISSEPDYLAVDGGGSISLDTLEKNLTLRIAYDYGHDIAGKTGTPFSVYSHVLDHHGFKLGATVVLDAKTIASFQGDLIVERGDQAKPYRYVPLFAPGTDVPVGASAEVVTALRLSARPAETLPLSRNRYALSGRVAHRFRSATIRLDERVYADTWAMKASTTDARLLFDVGRLELGPHARFHGQTAVDFWQRAYTMGPGFSYPELRTGDRELGPLVNMTGGFSFAVGIGRASRPRSWVFGVDVNVTETEFLDDLYLTNRLSTVGSLSLEAEL